MTPPPDAPTAVIALGGNALAPAGEKSTIYDQFRHTRESLGPIVDLARNGWNVCVVHGNGPQVGDELVRNEVARAEASPLPLGVLVAATAGWIGYMIQQSIENALRRAGSAREVVTLITQVQVRADDPALAEPTKFIGQALSPERAEELRREGHAVKVDGRGNLRRVVGSPVPQAIHELEVIKRLVERGTLVIACGGGGAPIYDDPVKGWEGIDAVIDKDLAAAVLARDLGARLLLILTDVDAVYADWGSGGDGPREGVWRGQHGAEGPRRNRLRAPHRRPRGHHRPRSRPGRGARRGRNDHHSGDGVNIHEYQAKDILRAEGVPIPPGEVATTPDEVEAIARKIGGMVVVKAQVHTGGRGKAGGVKLAKTPAEAREIASRILGMKINGLTVYQVLVTSAADIASEAYVGIILDRATKKPVFMVSPAGGIDIEEVAAKTPEKILKLPIDTRYGLQPYQASELGFFLFPDDVKKVRAAGKIMQQLYAAFMKSDASLAEINPLVVTPAGEVLALDAKISIDDNALDRHADLAALRDETAEAPSEVEARNANLTFIKLDGDVGCVVNGAGLAMATMDLVKYYGGEPANFLDIGGSSNPEKVVNALRIITEDPSVKVILFNIFGGITRTDDVANGIVTATKANPLTIPIVIRLTGTNEEIAMKILHENGFTASSDMDEAVEKAVALAKGGKAA
jgi:succinyl-CoA synthetase beta subunit